VLDRVGSIILSAEVGADRNEAGAGWSTDPVGMSASPLGGSGRAQGARIPLPRLRTSEERGQPLKAAPLIRTDLLLALGGLFWCLLKDHFFLGPLQSDLGNNATAVDYLAVHLGLR
jgi:hypothetical protein